MSSIVHHFQHCFFCRIIIPISIAGGLLLIIIAIILIVFCRYMYKKQKAKCKSMGILPLTYVYMITYIKYYFSFNDFFLSGPLHENAGSPIVITLSVCLSIPPNLSGNKFVVLLYSLQILHKRKKSVVFEIISFCLLVCQTSLFATISISTLSKGDNSI